MNLSILKPLYKDHKLCHFTQHFHFIVKKSTMDKDRKVIKSKRAQEKKKKKKVKIQQDSESKKKPQKMKASTSAPVRVKYQTRSKTKQQEILEWDSDWKEFLSTYVPPSEEYSSS
ncbi:hypothetical protein QL285_016025 [Trifolium repens]|nr:hypothetical protein QL285_016025 [Trifolium repens]